MSAARWRLIANLCLLLVVGGIAWAWIPYFGCVFDVTDAMDRELNPLTEQWLGELVQRALGDGVTEAPATFGERASLAQPVCREEHPHSDGIPGYMLALFGVFAFLFTRNQARLGTVDVDAALRASQRKRTPDRHSGRTPIHTPMPLDVDVDIGLSDKDRRLLEAVGDLDHRDESLMMYLQRRTGDEEEEAPRVPPELEGCFCPVGYADKSILWVDPNADHATDELAGEDPVNNLDRPFKTITAALDLARRLVHEEAHKGVMVRVMPGVYQAAIEIPDRCVVVNHRLPAEGSFRTRLKWMTDQSAEDDDAVTFLAPPDARIAVGFEERGAFQGLYGCHIVGREAVRQAGIIAIGVRSLTIGNCTIEGFSGGGVRLQDAGTELPGGHVLLHGCLLQRNESKSGGAIYALRSSLTLADCVLESNRAVTGGAIYGADLRAPLALSDCRIAHNRAQLERSPQLDLQETKLEDWKSRDGLGGGLYLRNARIKAVGTAFVENGASVAGGGMALLGCRVILEESDHGRPRFARNKARIGGALALVGWYQHDSTVKATDVLVEENHATISGGGFTGIGKATIQCVRGAFTDNDVTDDEGVGGALAVHLGGKLQLAEVEVTDNKSAGYGGGIAAVDGHVAIKESSRVRGNMARISGGGIYAVTTASAVAAKLADGRDIQLPLRITLENVKISNNASTDLGGGLRAGNEEGRPTLALAVQIAPDVVFQINRTKSQVEHGDDVWVVWAKQVKATDRNRSEKIILR